jgi:hypothetical protein
VQVERRLSFIPRATEANERHIHLRVLYIIRVGRVSESGLQNKRKRKPTIRPLAFMDFSRSRIEENYVASHPAKWSEYQQKLEATGRSAETNTEFFDVNKLIFHFRRVQDSSVNKKVNRDVGDLIYGLYEKNEDYAADDPDVSSVTILENYDSDSDSDEGSGDEDHQGYVADLGSEATFLHAVELVKAWLSYRPASELVALNRSKISGARSRFRPVTRQMASKYTRLIAVAGLDAIRQFGCSSRRR